MAYFSKESVIFSTGNLKKLGYATPYTVMEHNADLLKFCYGGSEWETSASAPPDICQLLPRMKVKVVKPLEKTSNNQFKIQEWVKNFWNPEMDSFDNKIYEVKGIFKSDYNFSTKGKPTAVIALDYSKDETLPERTRKLNYLFVPEMLLVMPFEVEEPEEDPDVRLKRLMDENLRKMFS